MSGNVQRPSEAWERIKPFALRDLKTLISSGKSTGGSSEGYSIMLYVRASQKIRQYSVSEDGLNAALAAASGGDVVVLPAGTIAGNQTVPDGVSLVGLDRENCVLTGQIDLGASATLANLSVTRSGADAGGLTGVRCDGDGAVILGCHITIVNSSGAALGVLAESGGVLRADQCTVSATGTSGSYGYYANGSQITIEGGSSAGSTAPAGAE